MRTRLVLALYLCTFHMYARDGHKWNDVGTGMQPYGVSFSEALEESVNDSHRLFWNTPWTNVEAKEESYRTRIKTSNRNIQNSQQLQRAGIGSSE